MGVSIVTDLRLKMDWTSAELARRAGLFTSAIRNIETYRHKPNDRTIHKIARALEVDFESFRAAILKEFDMLKCGLDFAEWVEPRPEDSPVMKEIKAWFSEPADPPPAPAPAGPGARPKPELEFIGRPMFDQAADIQA
jgi:transcriptional regulator with XRE-family HTH domain